MKVVLLSDIKKLGKKGDVVELAEGYAKNFIIPKKMGVEASKENLNTLKLRKASEERQAKEKLEAANALAKKLDLATIYVTIKAGKEGKAYGSISTKEIYQAIVEQLGIEVDKKKIVLAEAIKSFGTHTVVIKLHPSVQANLKICVKEE